MPNWPFVTASICITVVVPTVVAMSYPVLDPAIGLPIIIVATAVGVASFAYGIWLNYLKPGPIDYAVWDDKDAFQLYEAACLWVEESPKLPMGRRAQRLYDEWRDKIYAGTLKRTGELTIDEAVKLAMERSEHFDRPRTSITPHTLVKRSSLIELAEAKGEAPRFLFPYRRGERG